MRRARDTHSTPWDQAPLSAGHPAKWSGTCEENCFAIPPSLAEPFAPHPVLP